MLPNITTAYEYGYGYGYDGGRRWRKDHTANLWTWYPCGVACSAGELVEQTSDLTGATWTTSATYLRAGNGCSSALLTRNSENHHPDAFGTFGIITNGTGATLSNNVYDAFSVSRYTSGQAQSQWLCPTIHKVEEELNWELYQEEYLLSERQITIVGYHVAFERFRTLQRGGRITAGMCRAACDQIFKSSSRRRFCYTVCEQLKGATCTGLRSVCVHYQRRGQSGLRYYNACIELLAVLCSDHVNN